MPDSSHPLLQLLHLKAILLLPPADQAAKAEPTELLTRSIAGSKGSYPPNHPGPAIWMAERARLMALQKGVQARAATRDGRRALVACMMPAMDALRGAIKAADMAFGAGGEVAKELKEELDKDQQFVAMLTADGI